MAPVFLFIRKSHFQRLPYFFARNLDSSGLHVSEVANGIFPKEFPSIPDVPDHPDMTAGPVSIHRYPKGPNELYDLGADPSENINLYGSPRFEAVIRETKRRMESWFSAYVVNPDIDGVKEEARGYGQRKKAAKIWEKIRRTLSQI